MRSLKLFRLMRRHKDVLRTGKMVCIKKEEQE